MASTITKATSHTHSRYQEFPPPPSLAHRLVCVWTQHIDEHEEDHYEHGVLPDGCVDIVWIGNRAPIVAGPATRRIVVKLPTASKIIGVRFRPGYAATSLGLPANELVNQDVPLADIWPGHAERLTESAFHHRSDSTGLRALATALTSRLAFTTDPDPAIRLAILWLARHPAGRVRDLACLTGISDRQLQRCFVAAVGYGPKTFQRILRFQRLLKECSGVGSARPDLADLACAAGYADQAHMCREFRELADTTPQALLTRVGSTLAMSDLFNTDDRVGD